MINLYYNYYQSDNKDRMYELDFCLSKILENKYIDNVFIFISKNDFQFFGNYLNSNENINIIQIEDRPTYKFSIETINKNSSNDDINILINSDCYIDESNTYLINNIKHNEVWCMNKYDVIDENFNLSFHSASCSQDCWIFRGKINNIENIDFNFGTPGCDNRFAYESKAGGYILRNPSKDIKIIHYHLSQIRTCPHKDWDKHRIYGSYEFIEPENII